MRGMDRIELRIVIRQCERPTFQKWFITIRGENACPKPGIAALLAEIRRQAFRQKLRHIVNRTGAPVFGCRKELACRFVARASEA